ncbi:MAG: glycine cleavage system protein H [Candidatus Marinimicrobia bacterium]|nr:glycine cleavage system protein H [Candidatus Neomarinimicrobiota bacterium]|tara:strand:- start:144 stop:521 length:378 start_codon:yes stop_codon:yes gene_type:complete
MKIPDNLNYTKDHEWVQIKDGIATVGVTDFAQSELGDIVFIEFPGKNESFQKGDSMVTIEAVKTVADLYAPISGKVIEFNYELEENAEIINSDPFGKGWIIKLEISDSSEAKKLLTADEYENMIQ